jgi:hypothetical protein
MAKSHASISKRCPLLTERRQHEFIITVDRETPGANINELVEAINLFQLDMETQQFLHKSALYRFLDLEFKSPFQDAQTSWIATLDEVSLPLALEQNVLILVGDSVDAEGTNGLIRRQLSAAAKLTGVTAGAGGNSTDSLEHPEHEPHQGYLSIVLGAIQIATCAIVLITHCISRRLR